MSYRLTINIKKDKDIKPIKQLIKEYFKPKEEPEEQAGTYDPSITEG